MTTLRQRVAELVAQATEGQIAPPDALADGASLQALGLGSLGLIRLIDAIELEYGVEIEIGGAQPIDTVDDIVDRLEGAPGVRRVPG